MKNYFDGWLMSICKSGGKYVVCNEIGFRLAAYDENRNVVYGPKPFDTKDEAENWIKEHNGRNVGMNFVYQ